MPASYYGISILSLTKNGCGETVNCGSISVFAAIFPHTQMR